MKIDLQLPRSLLEDEGAVAVTAAQVEDDNMIVVTVGTDEETLEYERGTQACKPSEGERTQLNVTELRRLCKLHSLRVRGARAELIARLADAKVL